MKSRALLPLQLLFTFSCISGLNVACTKSEAELRQEDRAKIGLIVAEDVRASTAMGEVDQAARKGDVLGALDTIEKRAKPAIEAGLKVTTTVEPKTAWGHSKRSVLSKILEDRRAEIGPYTEALKSGEREQLVDALEAQAKIERRALAAVAEVNEGR